mgnify:CR=1 FL=1
MSPHRREHRAVVTGLGAVTPLALGADIVLGNTYHLMLRPGAERVARLGGLHKEEDRSWARFRLNPSWNRTRTLGRELM